jgi:hypothetical protein
MKPKLGATGHFPQGALGPDDEGALQIGIAHDSKGNVVLNFGEQVSWVAMPPAAAINFAKVILRHAGVKKIEITV